MFSYFFNKFCSCIAESVTRGPVVHVLVYVSTVDVSQVHHKCAIGI